MCHQVHIIKSVVPCGLLQTVKKYGEKQAKSFDQRHTSPICARQALCWMQTFGDRSPWQTWWKVGAHGCLLQQRTCQHHAFLGEGTLHCRFFKKKLGYIPEHDDSVEHMRPDFQVGHVKALHISSHNCPCLLTPGDSFGRRLHASLQYVNKS